MKLFRKHLERYHENTRDNKDRRVKVSKAVFSYEDTNGVEYRKGFTSVPFTPETKFFEIAPLEIIQ